MFIGGLIVLFIYISSLASNENLSIDLNLNYIDLTLIILLIGTVTLFNLNNQTPKILYTSVKTIIFKVFTPEIIIITIITMLYLLLTLLIVVNITIIKEGSLRPIKF